MKALKIEKNLLTSGVVANNRMNRGRGCLGANSYQKDLSFNPLEFLTERLAKRKSVTWLDLCCGEGRALIEAARFFAEIERTANPPNQLRITGVDLAGMFREYSPELKNLRLLETSVEDFEPVQEFDLITCVHGLHYLGDKLSILQKAARLLKSDGLFRANLELQNLKLIEKPNSSRIFSAFLRKQGFIIDHRKHLLTLQDKRNFEIPFEYLGADDQAGPNSTRQPVIDSYYKF